MNPTRTPTVVTEASSNCRITSEIDEPGDAGDERDPPVAGDLARCVAESGRDGRRVRLRLCGVVSHKASSGRCPETPVSLEPDQVSRHHRLRVTRR